MVSSTVEAPAPHDNLTEIEAGARASLLTNLTYSITLALSGDPGAETFGSRTEITFDAAEGASTFIDLAAETVDRVELNQRVMSGQDAGFDGHRLQLTGLRAKGNRLLVHARCTYSVHGIGLHRLVDPVDGRVYVYTHFEPYDAHKVFACWDQPDLKGTVQMTVRAPSSWRVCSNGRVLSTDAAGDDTITRFNTTPPLPPYLVALVGGPYHVITSVHKAIPLSLWCRESLVQYLEEQAADIFEVTRAGLDFFEEYFGYPYPFDEYGQLLVPEFNMGAMENPGCVTFNEAYVFRGRASETQLARRAETILHEMAHVCGFGDVVTMRWWGDLWLNETFATYMANLAMSRVTRFTNVWVDFANTVKSVAARQDQLETTHRIADDVPDTDAVRGNFDGITYHKGAAVLKQLVAWVGDDAFMRGVQDYFRTYRWGNATLHDFLDCLARASGRDVTRFAHDWLQTTGMNTLRPVFSVDENGHYTRFAVEQTATEQHPTLRLHHIAIGLFDRDDAGDLRRRSSVHVDIDGALTEVPALAGEHAADLVLVNDDDLTFTKLRFDDRSVETLLDGLSRLDDPLARALSWAALWDMTRDAELPARRYVEIVARHAPAEQEILLVERVLGQAIAAIDQFVAPEYRHTAMRRLHEVALEQLNGAPPGTDLQSAWFRSTAATAEDEVSLERVQAVLEGRAEVPGLSLDRELRWLLVGVLSGQGVFDAERINAEVEQDPTDIGRRRGAACLAARPLAEAKAEAWSIFIDPDATPPPVWRTALDRRISLSTLATIMAGFGVISTATAGFLRGRDRELLRPYVERYAEYLPDLWEHRSVEEAETFSEILFPRLFPDDDTFAVVEKLLGNAALPPAAIRILREGRDGLHRARRAQDADRSAATSSSG
ncbi:MAG: aminopeptidase N [Candidatus Dormibacteraeota bacterium]|nr:aminopeptidase N [Candidatus Dormibacteraeota bacterium]